MLNFQESLAISKVTLSPAVLGFKLRRLLALTFHVFSGVKEAFLHTYGDKEDSDGDVQGYHKKTQDKGSDGYKHFDSYHKKDGDKYGFEMHSEFGKENKGGASGGGKSEKYSEGYDNNSE